MLFIDTRCVYTLKTEYTVVMANWVTLTPVGVAVKCARMNHKGPVDVTCEVFNSQVNNLSIHHFVVDIDVDYEHGATNDTFIQLLPHISEIQDSAFKLYGDRIVQVRIFPLPSMSWPVQMALKLMLSPHRYSKMVVCASRPT